MALSVRFDDPNLVSCAGLAPAMALAQRAGLADLVRSHVSLHGEGGANPHLKIPALIGGMLAGADSIDDMDLLRHGGMDRLFTGVRARSTLGIFLRTFTFGRVRQLDAVAARFLPGVGQVAYLDVDDTVKATYGYTKQGAGYGYTKVKGLNALIATLSTPISAPVIVGTRLRRGNTNSARGAARLVADALATSRAVGAKALVIVRADSAYYGRDVIAAARWAGARFSVTARMTPTVVAAISSIPEQAWTPIQYPNAIWDENQQRLVSDASSRAGPIHGVHLPQEGRTHPRPAHRAPRQTPGPLAHLPSFPANGAWLVLAAIAFNLTRALGAAASRFHAKATIATIRAQLITVPARLARSARKLTMHLPRDWPWQSALEAMFTIGCGPPATLTT